MAEKELIFRRTDHQEVIARQPEDVANAGITVYPDALESIFGPGAARRYQIARVLDQSLLCEAVEPQVTCVPNHDGSYTTKYHPGINFRKGGHINF